MTQEQRLAAAEGLADVLARTTGTADHPTGLARATATATGELRSLDLHQAALAQGPDAVGRLVVETVRLATDAAVQTSYNEVAKSLGDSMAMAVEAFAGPPPLRTAPRPDAAAPAGPGWSGPPRPDAAAAAGPGWSGAPPRPGEPPTAGQRAAAAPPAPGRRTTPPPPAGRPAPPWAGQQPSRPAPRPEPEETDDDDYFADPFRGQRQ